MSKVPVETVVFVLVGVHQDPDPRARDIRKAVGALRRQGFTANLASADAICAQADTIRAQRADQKQERDRTMTQPDNVQERLAAMQGAFKQAKADAPGGQGPMPPDGRYQALVEGFDFFESNAGQLFLKAKLRLATTNGDEWDGHPVEKVWNVEDPDRIAWAKQDLATLGLNVDELDLSNLFDDLERLLDVPVEIQVKRSSKTNEQGQHYVNVYVNKRLGDPLPRTDVPAEAPEPAAVGNGNTDDVPF